MNRRIVLLAARTARSQTYAQAMLQRGLRVAAVVLFGDDTLRAGQLAATERRQSTVSSPLPLPDLQLPLEHSLSAISDQVVVVQAGHVNDTAVLAAVQALAADLLVYSGYGSQIVGQELLALGPPLLHVHAGWLPQFRGSTTLYYELLSHGYGGASALLLAARIDEGPVVARKAYPAPPPGMDMDYLYEPAMRADLLCDVLQDYVAQGQLSAPMIQSEDEAQTFYVIHPLLKHLAILGNQARQAA